MTNFLFWNTNRKAPDEIIARLVEELAVDVLLLIERDRPVDPLLARVAHLGPYRIVPSLPRFQLLVRFDPASIRRLKPVYEDRRSDYWHLSLPGRADILLVGVHGHDIRNYSMEAREILLGEVAANIDAIEVGSIRHKRTVVFGDFNANPFDSAVGSVRGLHAIRMRAVAGKHHRSHAGRSLSFFYNPMWALIGRQGSPPATYYYYRRQPHEIFWHMLDQVVLRPAALPMFPEQDLKIIHEAGGVSLLKRDGTPDPEVASDHLPLFFRLNLEGMSIDAQEPLADVRRGQPQVDQVDPHGVRLGHRRADSGEDPVPCRDQLG